jgi:hypothetical protein
MKYELKALSFGDTVGRAFSIYIDNFIQVFIISLISQVPNLLFLVLIGLFNSLLSNEPVLFYFLFILLYFVLIIITNSLHTGFIIEPISSRYMGEKRKFKDYIKRTLRFIFPLFGLFIVMGLMIGGAYLLFIFPAIYVGLGLSFAAQVLVIEKKGIFKSIGRSFKLAKGRRFLLFGYWLLTYAMVVILYAGVTSLSFFLMRIIVGSIYIGIIISIMTYICNSLIWPFPSCVFILVYYNIRIKDEGFALEHLVENFTREGDEAPEGENILEQGE